MAPLWHLLQHLRERMSLRSMGTNDMESRWERGNAMSSLIWALHQLVFRRIPSQESDLVSELCKFRRDTQRKHVDSDANGLLTSRSLAWDTNSSILWSLTASKTYLQKPMHPRRLSLLPCVQKALAGLTSQGTTKLCMWSQKFQYPYYIHCKGRYCNDTMSISRTST